MSNEIDKVRTELVSTEKGPLNLFFDAKVFLDIWKIADCLSKSDMVPKAYKNKPENIMIALEISQRMQASPMAVMQSLYVVNGNPAWDAKFTISAINTSGRFSPLRYDMQGDIGKENRSCAAWAYELNTKEKLVGPRVSIEMAKKEGWYGKSGSKWPNMPELMLMYRASTFFGRLYAPDVLNGMRTADEIRDQGSEDEFIIDTEEQLKEEISKEANKQVIDVNRDNVDLETGEVLPGIDADPEVKTESKSTEEKLPPF